MRVNSMRARAASSARRARPSYTSAALNRGAPDIMAAVTRSMRASPAICAGVGAALPCCASAYLSNQQARQSVCCRAAKPFIATTSP